MASPQLTHAETIALLAKKAEEKGDNFWVKVFRRRVQGQLPDSVATFGGASVQHFQHPEMWLPRLLGGGPTFLLSGYHEENLVVPIGDFITINVPVDGNPPRASNEIDTSILKSPGWTGPRTLEWPTPEDVKRAQPAQQAGYSVPSLAAASSGNSAANNVPGGGPSSGVSQLQWQLQQQSLQMQQLQAQLEAAHSRAEAAQREADEVRRRNELESIKRDAEERQRASDAKIEKALARIEAMSQVQPAKVSSIIDQLPALIAAVAPILEGMRKSSDDLRAAMATQQAQQQQQTQTMLTAMMGRPSVDPAVEKSFDRMMQILEKSKSDATPPHEMLHNMAEAMSTMTSMTLDLAEAAANVGGGGQRGDHPALSAIKQGVKAVTSLMEGYQQSVQQKMGVPPHVQQPPQIPQYVQQAQQPVPQYAPQPQQVQQQPAQIVQFPPREPAPPMQATAPNVAEAQPAVQQVDAVTYLENMIKGFAPPADVARQFILSIDDSALQVALAAAGDDPNELVAQRLGGWVMATQGAAGYLGLVLKELEKQGVAAGIFEPDDGDDDLGDDDLDGAEAD